MPGVSGSFGLATYVPWRNRMSAKFTPTAYTLMSTMPGRTSGFGTSDSARTSGPPTSAKTIAFMSDPAAKAAVHVDALAGDVARLRRAEEGHQIRHVGGIAEVPERDLAGELLLALAGRMQALVDLLAVDPAGREGVHGDAVPADLAREAFRPRVHRGLGRPRRIRPGWLRGAGHVE